MDKIPQAISESDIEVLGMKVRVAVLDDGTRVFEKESFTRLLNVLFNAKDKFTAKEMADMLEKLYEKEKET